MFQILARLHEFWKFFFTYYISFILNNLQASNGQDVAVMQNVM
jgi:hypothetical protein